MRRWLSAFLAVCLGLAVVLIGLELGLRLLPVNEGLRLQAVDATHPVAHYQPDRDLVWSRFADFSLVNRIHVNNVGFVNDQDYAREAPLPLLAVIGDSYVEAAMVPYAGTLQGRLARALEGRMRVYSFGISGAPLSQYLAFADFARRTFHPAKMVVVVVGNDFDESLLRPGAMPGFQYFRDNGTDHPPLVLKDYAPGSLRRLLRHSRLASYLFFNLQVQALPARLFSKRLEGEFAGQTSAEADPARLESSRRAALAFLGYLPKIAGLPPKDICLLVDGIRPQLYTRAGRAETAHSYFAQMRDYLLKEAATRGFETVDMQSVFIADFEARHRPFESPRDGHWNAYGHEVAAETLLRSPWLAD